MAADGGAARRAEFAAFLRTRRARLRPADVGLPPDPVPGLRRTPGLRREEVARLSGVGVTWYTWLEQGRDITASAQVVDALARALRLDADEYAHLRLLAGLPARRVPDARADDDDATRRLQRLVDAVHPNPASMYDRCLDYVAWNAAYARVRYDPGAVPRERRNLVWMMFTNAENRARMRRWEPAARAVLGQCRAALARSPDDPRCVQIVADLGRASPEFRQWWAEYPVRSFRPVTIGITHPDAGRIDLEMFQLRPVERPDLLLVVQKPVTVRDAERVASLLAAG